MKILDLLHRIIPWVRAHRHGTSDSAVVADEGLGDDQALDSSYFHGVDYDPVNDED